MSQSSDINSEEEKIVPPEERLTAPTPQIIIDPSETNETEPKQQASAWLVVAKNKRINKDWEELLIRSPENTRRCYKDLCYAPMTRKPGRVFPLRGKLYRGAWEYEVTSSDRVFYVPIAQESKVVVYYAGEHPKKNAPLPP